MTESYIVQITRTEEIAFAVQASDPEDAADRYLMDGEEMVSETTSTVINSIDQGTAEEVLG